MDIYDGFEKSFTARMESGGEVSYTFTLAMPMDARRKVAKSEDDIMATAELLACVITAWDVTSDGEPAPITVDSLMTLPLAVYNEMVEQVMPYLGIPASPLGRR